MSPSLTRSLVALLLWLLLGKTSNNISSKAASASKKIVKHKAGASKKNEKPAAPLKPALEAILQTLGKLRAIRKTQPTREMVQNMSGNAKTKAGYEKNCGILRKQGFVEYPCSKTVALTDQGIQHVGEPDPSDLSNETFHAAIKEMIPPKAGLIFDALIDGKVHDRKQTAKDLGYDMNKLSGYDKNLSRMSSLGFLTYDKKTIQLTKMCFPLDDDEDE